MSRQWALHGVRAIAIGIAPFAVGIADAVPVDFCLRLFVLSCDHVGGVMVVAVVRIVIAAVV